LRSEPEVVSVATDVGDGDDSREMAMTYFFARRGGERRLSPTSLLDTGRRETGDPSTL
jgi:hypothetical protein